jgi:hypothetical protein
VRGATHHQQQDHRSDQRVTPAALRGERTDDQQRRADRVGGGHQPHPPLSQPDRGNGEGDGG